MLLISLTTIYQGCISILTHTQHHAESLSRSHLKYVLTGELDTYVTSLIHDLTNSIHCTPKTYHTRHKHTQPTPNTNNEKTSRLPTPTPSRKRTHATAEIPTLHQPTPPTETQKHLKKPVNATTPLHSPTRPQNAQKPLTQDPTYKPQSQTALHTHDGKHVEPPCNHQP